MAAPAREITLGDVVDEYTTRWDDVDAAMVETVVLEYLDELISDIGSVVEVFRDHELFDLALTKRGLRRLRELLDGSAVA